MPEVASLDRDNQGKYRYTSFNQFIVHVRKYLLDHGLVLTPIYESAENGTESTQRGSYETVILEILWKLTHVSGQWEMWKVISYANNQDKGGKHYSKALSYNIKDALRSAFLIPSGGDEDPDDDRTKDSLQDKLDKSEAELTKAKQAIVKLQNQLKVKAEQESEAAS